MNKEEAIDILKGWRDYNKKHKNMLLKADEIIEVQDTVLNYIEELEHKLKQAKKYIEEEMYVDYNVTICGGEEEFYKELPISLNLYNEDLRKLLDMLGE